MLSVSSASANGEENIDDEDQFIGAESISARKRRNSYKDPRSTRLSVFQRVN